jgi:hypothetical protein
MYKEVEQETTVQHIHEEGECNWGEHSEDEKLYALEELEKEFDKEEAKFDFRTEPPHPLPPSMDVRLEMMQDISFPQLQGLLKKSINDDAENIYEKSLEEQSKLPPETDTPIKKFGSVSRVMSLFASQMIISATLLSSIHEHIQRTVYDFIRAMVELQHFPVVEQMDLFMQRIHYVLYYTYVMRSEQYLKAVEKVTTIFSINIDVLLTT